MVCVMSTTLHRLLAMTLIIMRRALWPTGRSSSAAPRVRVGYRGHTVWLNARGEWYAA